MAEKISVFNIENAYAAFVVEARKNGIDTTAWVLLNVKGSPEGMRVTGRPDGGGLYPLTYVPNSGFMGTTGREVYYTLIAWAAGMRMAREAREDRERKAND